MKTLGTFLIVAGVAGSLYFAFVFSAAPGGVLNLDLQQDRLFGFLDAQVNFLAGILILLFVNLSLKIQVLPTPAPPLDFSGELAKRAPVDPARLRTILQSSKSGAPAK